MEDSIVDIKTQRNVMTDKAMIADYDKILVQLEKASENLISVIVIFQRHEGSVKASIGPRYCSFCTSKTQFHLSDSQTFEVLPLSSLVFSNRV